MEDLERSIIRIITKKFPLLPYFTVCEKVEHYMNSNDHSREAKTRFIRYLTNVNDCYVRGIKDFVGENPYCKNFTGNKRRLDHVLPLFPHEIAEIVHKYSVMTYDDIVENIITELTATVKCHRSYDGKIRSIEVSNTPYDNLSAEEKLSLTYYEPGNFIIDNICVPSDSITIRCTRNMVDLFVADDSSFMTLHATNIVDSAIKTVNQNPVDIRRFAPMIVKIIFLWKCYTM